MFCLPSLPCQPRPACLPCAVLLDPRELARRDRRVLGRTIAVPGEPRRRPHQADRADDDEAEPPAPAVDQQQRDGNRQHPPDARPEEHDAVGLPALAQRKPLGQPARHAGEGAGFSGAEQEPRGDERAIPHGCAGQHRERRPPQHDARQHAAGTDHVDEPSRRDFEHRVGERERAQHLTHLDRREMQIVADERRGRRDADAIEIGDDGEEKGEEQDAEPRPRSRGGFQVHRRYSSGS